MDATETPSPSPVFKITTAIITLVSVAASFGLAMVELPAGKAALAVLIVYVWITGMMAGVAKFPSSAGMAVETPIGAPVNWRAIFMIGGIMTFILVGAGGAASLIFAP